MDEQQPNNSSSKWGWIAAIIAALASLMTPLADPLVEWIKKDDSTVLEQVDEALDKCGKEGLDLLEVLFDADPQPAWLKVLDEEKDRFVVAFVNTAYTKEFGIAKHRYKGKSDKDVWDKYYSDYFGKVDRKVYKSGKPENEVVIINNHVYLVTKFLFPLKDTSGKTIKVGVAGRATRVGDEL